MLAVLIDIGTFHSFILNMNCSSYYRIDSTIGNVKWLNIFLSKLAHFLLSEVAQIFIDKGKKASTLNISTIWSKITWSFHLQKHHSELKCRIGLMKARHDETVCHVDSMSILLFKICNYYNNKKGMLCYSVKLIYCI